MAKVNKKAKRLECAEQWLRRARKDFNAFKKLTPFTRNTYENANCSDPALAMYLLQQSIEKAVKAAVIASGQYSTAVIRRHFGHKSFDLLLDFFSKSVFHIRELGISELYESFGVATVDEAEKKLSMKISYDELVKFPPDTVLVYLDLVQRMRKDVLETLCNVWGPHSKIKISIEDLKFGSAEEILDSFSKIWETDLGMKPLTEDQLKAASFIPKLAEEFGFDLGAGDKVSKNITISRSAQDWLGLWSLGVALVILTALTVAHEESSRYPFLPGESKGATTTVKLSCEDYNENLGVVKHIGYLGYTTGLMLDDMKVMLEPIANFFELKITAS